MTKSACDACGSAALTSLYRLPRIPAFQNRLFESAAAAKAAPRASVDLTACGDCGFIFNTEFDATLMGYDGSYQNAQDHSQVFRAYLDGVADILLREMRPGARLAEIGCGKGYFLEVLKERGASVVGFDPAYEGDSPDIHKAYFDGDAARSLNVEGIVMRHTLEHVEKPFAFLKQLKTFLPVPTRIFIEVPRFEWIAERQAFWDIFHEHCNYFTEDFFRQCFGDAVRIEPIFGGQYMLVSASTDDLVARLAPQKQRPYRLSFAGEIAALDRQLGEHGTNYVWGTGAKGITFVNILDAQAARVQALVDLNPRKQGCFVPLTGHPCVAPGQVDFAGLSAADCIWIMNGNYRREILASLPPLQCTVRTLGE